ncbi:MAG: DUF2975 domain-containing protein [Clostridia bacterium]|nr:DUF2975 domain-containing protein [Clostridia bacterium]
MNWTKDKSITLSFFCLAVFALLLLALDVFCYPLTRWFIGLRAMHWQQGIGMMVTVYVCSVFAWLILYFLWKLLSNLRMGNVFTDRNVRFMRIVSWCCVGVGIMCLISTIWYLPFAFVAIAAAFIALIVRIVKNVFQQAISMKDELDLTI